MSSGRRGRGGGDRGGRGARGGGGNSPFRGGISRGKTNGFDTPTRPSLTEQDSPRGGAPRGGAHARGGQDARNNYRGRASTKSNFTGNSASMTYDPNFRSSDPMNSTPFPADDFRSRLEYLRNDRPRQRAELIRKRLMDPDGQMKFEDRVEKYGLCTDMCSEFERVRRIVEMDLKAAECTPETQRLRRNDRIPDESRMVKAHTRSAAGTENELMTDVRTPDTCLRTLKHMFQRLDTDGMEFLYSFIWDRSRSVRKDLSVGALRPGQGAIYLQCVEMCVRFHLLSLHHMAKSKSGDYNHTVDHGNDIEQLRNCYTSLRHHYSDDLTRKVESPNRAEFIAYDIIVGLRYGDRMLEYTTQMLESHYQNNKRIQTALAIVRAGETATSMEKATFTAKRQNWIEFWRLVKSHSVSYLMACAAELSFNNIRQHVLNTLRMAYRPRNNRQRAAPDDWTLEKLMEPLGFDNPKQVKDFCKVYGFDFGYNIDGVEYLDLGSVPQPGNLARPPLLHEQYFSETIVEVKRYGRKLSAVIQGMSVHEAKVKGLVEPHLNFGIEEDKEAQELDNEGSLFVPEASTPKQIFGIPANGATEAPKEPAGNPKLNPFASSFQPATKSNPFLANTVARPNPFLANMGAKPGPSASNTDAKPNPFLTNTVAKPNPFLANTDAKPNPFQANTDAKPNAFPTFSQNGGAKPATPATMLPGLFDPLKNSIQFATATSNGTPLSGAKSDNPFKAAPTTQAAPSLFAPVATPAVTSTPSLSFPAAPSMSTPASSAQPSTTWSFPSAEKLNQNAKPVPSFSLGLSAPSSQPQQTFNFASQAPLQTTVNAQEEEQRKAQEAQRIANEQRRAREEQERQARAAVEQRRLQAEQERQRRIREEEGRKIKAEQERQAQIEQALQAQQEAERRARAEHDQALGCLAMNLVIEPEKGLMKQYLDNLIAKTIQNQAALLEEQRLKELADGMYEQKRLALARAACLRWYQQVQKKKKKAEDRRRRAELRALRAEAEALKAQAEAEAEALEKASALEVQAPAVQPNATQFNGAQDSFKKPKAPVVQSNATHSNDAPDGFKKPEAPASVQRQKETPKPKKEKQPPQMMKTVSKKIEPTTMNATQTDSIGASINAHNVTSGITNSDYSEEYYKSKAPTDRTETDWFKLRAMGIDPSLHRKRSFGSVSSDDDKVPVIELKRARRSTSSSVQLSLPPPSTDEELLARFNAVRVAHRTSATPRSFSGNRPACGNTSVVIAQARELLAQSPTPRNSPPSMQHKYSRSVPSLDVPNPSPGLSMFGRSIGAAPPNEKPAFWGRTSRFVPQHLYGKGPEAIRAYRTEMYGRSPASSAPLDLSSPIPTQQSYIPAGEIQYEYEKSSEHAVVDDGDTEDEGDDSLIDYGEEYDEEEADQEDMFEEQYGEYYDEEGGSDMSEEPLEQFSQKPGATQDDAIELSD